MSESRFSPRTLLLLARDRLDYAVLAAVAAWLGRPSTINNTDFSKGYLSTGRAIFEGLPLPYDGVAGFVNLPLFGVTMLPFAPLSDYQAGIAFWASQIVALVVAYHLVVSSWATTRDRRILAFALFATSVPFYIGIRLGQTSVWALVFLIGCLWAHTAGRDRIAGALLSGMFIIKVPLGLLFFYFLAKRSYQTILASMATFIAFVVASVLIMGWAEHVVYLNEVWLGNTGGVLPGRFNQSVQAFAARFTIKELHLYEPVTLGPIARWGSVFAALGLLGVVGRELLQSGRGSALLRRIDLSIALVFALLVTPVVWHHYHIFLIVAWAALYDAADRGEGLDRTYAALGVVSWVLVNLPYMLLWEGRLENAPASGVVYPFLVSSAFLGTVLLLVGLLRAGRERAAS